MTIKTTTDGDAVTTETMADRLRFVQTEPWRKMRYTDENDEAAWDIYNDSLFLQPQPEEPAGAATAAASGTEIAAGLEGRVPQFGTRWGDTEYLEAVSGMKKSEPPLEVKEENSAGKPKKTAVEEPKKPKGRPRGGAAVGTASRRGGKTSRASTSKTAIDID